MAEKPRLFLDVVPKAGAPVEVYGVCRSAAPRYLCHLPTAVAARPAIYHVSAMFQLKVDDEITLVLAEERHARVMTDLIARNQSRLARWEPWAEQPATLEGTRAYIRAALEDFVRGRQISTIIALDRGRLFIGRCGMRINPQLAAGDIGYWIDGEYEGRGITSRAARALISAVFDELRLSRVDLRTSVENTRSRGLAERLGFTFEGVLPRGLQFMRRADDVALYGMTSKQWAKVGATAAAN